MNPQQKVNIAKLAEEYGRQVFHSAYRILSDTHLAEDVTQEVFLKLFKKSTESFDQVKHWPGYLKNMAISGAIEVSSMYYQGKMFSNEQLTMQIEVYHQAPSKVRVLTQPVMNEQVQMEVISILDTSLGKGVTLMPHAKVAIPMSFTPGENVSDPDQDPLLWVNKVLDYEGEVIQLPASWINGVFANAYQIEAEGMKVTVWINGETQLPVSLTVESPYVDGKRTFVLEANLEFNQLLDPALFDLNPSDEYKLVNGDN